MEIGFQETLYIFVSGAMLMLSVLGLGSAIGSPSMESWDKRFFTVFFSILVLSSSTIAVELIVFWNPGLTFLLVFSYFINSFLSVAPYPMLAVYLLHCCGEDWKGSHLFHAMVFLWGSYLTMLLVAQFTPVFYSVSPDNELMLGPGYLLSVAPVFGMLLTLVVGVVRRKDKLPQRYHRAFLICLLPMTIAVIVHSIFTSFVLISIGMCVSAYAMYRVIEVDTFERDLRQQREIASQRASIAILQMRPHFIYNTMTSIYYLCDQNPVLAKKVTMDFTTYLRKIFTAIASDEVIPFLEELEHTRAYLAVEQVQYEDDLIVEYDTPHTDFHVPPLTLQPIVENAVKHGMDPDAGPLHIWVRTRETLLGSEVVVENDGAGFDLSVAKKPHTTLLTIQYRLEMMCGGRLSISPREGGGIVVKIMIPKRGEKERTH